MSQGKKTEDQATASRILNAAEEHFAAQGLAGARTDQIALAAHANKAMLYYYFGNKRRLHRAVLENLLRQFRSRVLAPPHTSLPARERLLDVVSNYFDFLASHPNYPRLVQREAMEAGRFDWMAREFFGPLHHLLARTLADGMASREFRILDAEQAAQIAMGVTTSYFAAAPILSQVVGHNLLAPQAVAARKRALLDFLDHGVIRRVAKPRAARSTAAKFAGAKSPGVKFR